MSQSSSLDHVRDVLERHRADILARYGAVGVGIGKPDPTGSSYAITVYLESASQRPTEPVSIEGVPLQFKVTGRFKPLRQQVR